MNEKTLTLEAVKEQFCTADKQEALKKMRQQLDEEWDIEAATQLMIDIGNDMDQQIKENDLDWAPVERILWSIREAFILGSLDMAEKLMMVNDICYEDLAEKVSSTPREGRR